MVPITDGILAGRLPFVSFQSQCFLRQAIFLPSVYDWVRSIVQGSVSEGFCSLDKVSLGYAFEAL